MIFSQNQNKIQFNLTTNVWVVVGLRLIEPPNLIMLTTQNKNKIQFNLTTNVLEVGELRLMEPPNLVIPIIQAVLNIQELKILISTYKIIIHL